LANSKRRGFFVVKRTASNKISTGFFQRHIALYNVYDIQTIKQVLNEIFWNQASTAFSLRLATDQ